MQLEPSVANDLSCFSHKSESNKLINNLQMVNIIKTKNGIVILYKYIL